MKTSFLSVVIMLLALSTNSVAQAPTGKPQQTGKSESKKDMSPEEKAKHESTKAEKKLALTPEQKTKWEQAALTRITANSPYIEKLRGSTTPEERKELKSKVKANGQSFDATVNGFLTPEQKTKWETLKAEKKKDMQHQMKEKMHDDEFED